MRTLLRDLAFAYEKLRPQVIQPAEGFIKYDYLIPAGFYKQMWDWDGFFIGCHLASRGVEDAHYLKYWVLNFVAAADEDGYVPGCVTTAGPRPLFGKFAMKPFLAQGATFAARGLGDFEWLAPVYERIKAINAYTERTQLDADYGLCFWDNAMQSGADNNPALTNAEDDRSAILACDASTFLLREYRSLAHLARALGHADDAREYERKAEGLKTQMLTHLWFDEDQSFFNIRRDIGEGVRCVSYSNFLPLVQGMAPQADGRAMIQRYLWNKDHMLSPYGSRTLSKQDKHYNNANIIVPYSNWQGPIWPIANYLYSIALVRYGFEAEAAELVEKIGRLVLDDIRSCGSMHENYHADTGAPLAPTAEQSGGVFTGFVGWNLLVQNMLEGAVTGDWLLLEVWGVPVTRVPPSHPVLQRLLWRPGLRRSRRMHRAANMSGTQQPRTTRRQRPMWSCIALGDPRLTVQVQRRYGMIASMADAAEGRTMATRMLSEVRHTQNEPRCDAQGITRLASPRTH